MAWLIKRKDTWYIGWRENGKDRYESTGTPDEEAATIKLKEKDLSLSINKGSTPVALSLSFDEVVALYKENSDVEEGTRKINDDSWGKWKTYSGIKTVKTIKSSDVIDFKNKLEDDGYSPASIHIYLRDLNKLLGFACQKKLISHNPCKKEESDKWVVDIPDSEDDDFHVLTIEEEQKLMAEANPLLRRLIPFSLETGLRLSQTIHADFKQFNPHTHLFKVGKQKRQKARSIPILSHPVVSKCGVSAKEAMGPVRFQGKIFEEVKNADQIEKMWARLRTRCGFYHMEHGERVFTFDWHDLRHTCASRLCAILTPIEVRDFFGWSSVALVDRYTHSRTTDIQAKMLAAQNYHATI